MNVIRVSVSDLSGAALDWAVSMTDAVTAEKNGLDFDDMGRPTVAGKMNIPYQPSKNWAQCGFLIDKYRPDVQTNSDGQIAAYLNNSLTDPAPLAIGRGDTYLIAICRAIVAAKLGESVQVPAELVEVLQ